jgi:hypothetical protein
MSKLWLFFILCGLALLTAGTVSVTPFYDPTSVHEDSVPASPTATGTDAHMAWDSAYLYVCVDANTWMRVQLSSWSVGLDTMVYEDGNTMIYENADTMVFE